MNSKVCPALPDADNYRGMSQCKVANKLFKHLLLRAENFDSDLVSKFVSQLEDDMKHSAVAHALNRCLGSYLKSTGLTKLKERIIDLIKLSPDSCIKNKLEYSPLHHILMQSNSTPDKEILTALLELCPSSPMIPIDAEGLGSVPPLHLHLLGADPNFESVLLILQYCPQSAR